MANSTTPRQPIKELVSLREQVAKLEAHQEHLTAQITAQMSQTFKDAPVGLCYFDSELRYVQINDFLAAINGLSVEEHVGKTVMEVLPEIAAAGVAKQLRQVYESGDSVIQGTITAETPAHPGEARTYAHDYHALRSDDGEIIGVSCCVVDITDLRRAEQERDNQSREIEEDRKSTTARAFRATDLEREVNELCERLGIKPKYNVPFDEDRDSPSPNRVE